MSDRPNYAEWQADQDLAFKKEHESRPDPLTASEIRAEVEKLKRPAYENGMYTGPGIQGYNKALDDVLEILNKR